MLTLSKNNESEFKCGTTCLKWISENTSVALTRFMCNCSGKVLKQISRLLDILTKLMGSKALISTQVEIFPYKDGLTASFFFSCNAKALWFFFYFLFRYVSIMLTKPYDMSLLWKWIFWYQLSRRKYCSDLYIHIYERHFQKVEMELNMHCCPIEKSVSVET